MDELTILNLSDFDAIIFDMDGTMINNMVYHKKAWMEFAKRHGLELTEEEFKEKFSGKKNDKIFEMIFNKDLSDEEIVSYTEEKEGIYRELYASDIKEVAGLFETLQVLKAQNKKLAIATTAPRKNREFGLEALHLGGTFPVILGDEDVTKGKPDPEIYLETAKRLGVDPSRCLVFEDTPPGVASGKNAGMTVVGIMTTHSEEDLHLADYWVKDFTSLNFR